VSEITCEFIVGSRAKNGKPTLCGQRAGTYQMAGGLGWVPATLCDRHAKAVTKLGYQLVPLGAPLPKGTRMLSAASDEESGCEFPALFANAVVGISD
jgi:hypothetical protein